MSEKEYELVLTREKARKAKDILESEVMGEVFQTIERQAFEAALRATDDIGRKRMLDKVTAIRELASELGSLVAAGHSASRTAPTLSS